MSNKKKKQNKVRVPPGNLAEWLTDKAETVSREKALTNRLISDLMIAAGARGYGLGVYEPLVDRDGFDLIIDDADSTKALQLKSRVASGAKSWEIRKNILRPSLDMRPETLGFTETVEGVGRGGGVILQNIHKIDEENTTIKIEYLYTDLYVLLALQEEVTNLDAKIAASKKKAANKILMGLHHGIGSEIVNIAMNAFVRVRSVSALLSLIGIHSVAEGYGWQTNLIKILDQGPNTPLNNNFRKMTQTEKARELNNLKRVTQGNLRNLII